ncbi:MAG: aspartate ammonia-lyase [Verrucomicrobia bacterium]|nr:MAG: aspartate ammonia-lyase [Verrucomicrobiota bacterium]
MRTEKDSLGEVPVPDAAWYGVHTVRSLQNFNVAGASLPREIIYGIAKLKWACAKANQSLGLLPVEKTEAIVAACQKILAGGMDDQFPIDVFQAGSGTSTNMNVNEVIANLANEALGRKRGDRQGIHPNDDVNKGESTNNVFPSAINVACVELSGTMLKSLHALAAVLRDKSREFSIVLKSGRTHLQDAVPVTLGQEFAAWARALEKDAMRLQMACGFLTELGIGGNAVGTGVNTPREFRLAIIRELSTLTTKSWRHAEDGLEATQFLTDLAGFSAALRCAAADVNKICNDLRLLASGPNTGFNEIMLPAVEPGSSIMPGKINPSICEAANMACMQIMGHDHTVQLACAAGQLELNTHMPVIGANLVAALKIFDRCCVMLATKCIAGITANAEVCRRHFEISLGLPTILNPRLGYDRVAELVKESRVSGKTLRDLVLEKKLLSVADLDALLKSSTGPNL